jgi:cyclopropane fatty-acyl-phospholipid synthase-like methyltransferase
MTEEYIKIGNSYKSKVFGNPSNIYLEEYWNNPIRSTIDEQVANVIEKNKLVMSALTHINPKNLLEIGCAPGVLLGELSNNFNCIGIEVDERNRETIQKYSKNADLIFGLFPDVITKWGPRFFSNIIALDVFEHVEDGDAFLSECNRLMVVEAHLIIQTPIILEDGQMEMRMFNGFEHIWIYGIEDITNLLVNNGFEVLKVERFILGHEQITAKKIK